MPKCAGDVPNTGHVSGGAFELVDEREQRLAGGFGHRHASYRTSYRRAVLAAYVRIRPYGVPDWTRDFGRERAFEAVRAASTPSSGTTWAPENRDRSEWLPVEPTGPQ